MIREIFLHQYVFQLYFQVMSNGEGSLLNFLRKTATQARKTRNTTKKSSTVMHDRHFDQRSNSNSIITFQGGNQNNYNSPKAESRRFENVSLQIPANQILLFERRKEQQNTNFQNFVSTPQNGRTVQLRPNNNPEDLFRSPIYNTINEAPGNTANFQSVRVESAQCLQKMSTKIRNQISNIDMKIQRFNSSMGMVLADHFKNLQEHIYQMVEEAIRQGMQQMKQYKRLQEQKLVGDLFRMKEILIQECAKLQTMRGQITQQNWRKIAGEIISNNLQLRINELLRRSTTMDARRWQFPGVNVVALKDIERRLVEYIKIR